MTTDTSPTAWHGSSAAETAAALAVLPERGLSSAEAGRRLAQAGPNVLPVSTPPGPLRLLLRQIESPLVLLLLLAIGISVLARDPQDALVILAVLILNTVVGFVEEWRAERALSALQALNPPVARVVRDGHIHEILAQDTVPGDLVVVRAGDLVPADGRLWESSSLYADESVLTGESVPVAKQEDVVLAAATSLPDRKNCLLMGTAVTFGHGLMVVTATGSSTEMGRLAASLSAGRPPPTPLQRQISWLGKILSGAAVVAAAAVFALGLLRGQPVGEMFVVAVSLAVAAVPEGLPAVMTLVLAAGVQRMARRNVIVRRLSAVEALGAATVICTDKTGTLTLGEMRVTALLAAGRRLAVGVEGLTEDRRPVAAADIPGLADALRVAALCNNARLGPTPVGDPTERALLQLAAVVGVDHQGLVEAWPRVGEIPFSSARRRMTTLHRRQDGVVACVKGAPDLLLARSSRVMTAAGPRPLTPAGRAELQDAVDGLAGQGVRVLALAERWFEQQPPHTDPAEHAAAVEHDLTFLSLVGLLDPPRPDVPAALEAARQAGVRVIMLSGDHPRTAGAIAHALGIEADRVLTGADLHEMDGPALAVAAANHAIYARVAPEQKVQIVRALQAAGEVVAMTGDGANDAPALRLADIGVAMGIRGTAVAKEAADMVLADDHFASIVAAMEEGRTIYANLRKAVLYLLSGNLGEILVLLIAMLVGLPLPLQAVQILWINLITDALPGVGLGVEPQEPGLMSRPPRAPGEPFLPGWTVPLIVVPSGLLAAGTLAAFIVALARVPDDLAGAQSAAFATLILGHLGLGWAQRATLAPSFRLSLRSNPLLLASLALGVALLVPLLHTTLGQLSFHTRPLDATAWALALVLAPLPLLGAEAAKAALRRRLARDG